MGADVMLIMCVVGLVWFVLVFIVYSTMTDSGNVTRKQLENFIGQAFSINYR